MEKPEHPSNSRIRLEIEKEVVKIISEKENIEFKTGIIQVGKDNVKLNFDFHCFSEELNIIGEIYTRIGGIKGAVEDKVASDCLKLVFAAKLIGKPCIKRLIFIDENVKREFEKETKWLARAIKELDVTVELVEISKNSMDKLQDTNKLQQIGNLKR